MIVAVWQQLLNKAGLNPRSVLWNKVKLLEPLVVLGYDAFNELTQVVTAHYEETKTEDEEGMLFKRHAGERVHQVSSEVQWR